jgi:chorismate mutase
MALENFRKEINEINLELFDLIKRRMDVSKKVGEFKKQNNMPIFDVEREKDIFEKLAEEKGLDKVFIRNLFELIIKQSKEEQK